MLRVLVVAVLSVSVAAVGAEDSLERTAERLEGKLMSPCCMSGTVAEHSSPIAFEMRGEIRAMLADGLGERDVLDHYVEQYGQQILAIPDARGFNLAAYALPLVFLVLGAAGVVVMLRHWRSRVPERQPADAAPADPVYQERLRRELRELD